MRIDSRVAVLNLQTRLSCSAQSAVPVAFAARYIEGSRAVIGGRPVISLGSSHEGAIGEELVGHIGVVEVLVLDLVALATGLVVNVRIVRPAISTHKIHYVARWPANMHIKHVQLSVEESNFCQEEDVDSFISCQCTRHGVICNAVGQYFSESQIKILKKTHHLWKGVLGGVFPKPTTYERPASPSM